MKFSIDGNIGCGKSTIMNLLNAYCRIPTFLEPIHLWKDWLEEFYKNPQRWGLTFNLHVLNTYFPWKSNTFDAIYERSPFSCKYIFMEMQKKNNDIHPLESKLFDELFEILSWKPDIFIYIKTDPKTCFQRMEKRNRECENGVPLSYLEALHHQYEEFMATQKDVRISVIDGNQNEDQVLSDVCKVIDSCQKYR